MIPLYARAVYAALLVLLLVVPVALAAERNGGPGGASPIRT